MMKILLFGLFAFQQFAAQVPQGYVAAWTFCGNANDISGNGHHGAVFGASLTTDRNGIPNTAYSFNGTNAHIDMPSAIITGTASRSISFWAKSTGTNIGVGFGYGDASLAGGIFQVVFNYNCQGVGFDNSQAAIIRSGNVVNNAQWHHIVAVLNSTLSLQVNSISIYVDGALQTNSVCQVSDPTSTVNSNGDFPVILGKSSNSSQRFFKGALDDFYFYNRVLTSGEISQLYNATTCTVTGIEDPAGTFVSAFPNPFSKTLTVRGLLSGDVIAIYSMLGNCVLSEQVDRGKTVIDTNELPNGLYILVSHSNGKTTRTRVIKE